VADFSRTLHQLLARAGFCGVADLRTGLTCALPARHPGPCGL